MTSLALACKLGTAAAISQLPTRVKRILRKYGATLLMPGPAVPILGPERIVGNWSTPAGYDNATAGNGQSVTVTAGTTVGARAAIALQPLEVGKTYRATARCLSQTATTGFYVREGSVPGNGTTTLSSPGLAAGGYYEATFAATRTDYNVLTSANVAASYAFADISVREVLGYQNTYSSFIAGNYRESTGQNLAAVDQQVGRALNAARAARPELTAGNAWSSAAGIAAVGAELHFSGATGGASLNAGLAVLGSLHEVTYEIYDYVSGGVKPFLGATSAAALGNSNGWRTELVVADDNRIRFFVSSSPATLKVRNISVRELPGIHALQATSGFQPYLRKVPKTLGQNLVSNGDFANGLAGWSLYGSATGQVVNGEAEVVAAATNSRLERNIPGIVAGKEYWASASIRGSGQATSLTVIRGAAGNYGTIATSGSAATSRKAEFGFYATGADAIVQFLPSSGTGVGTGYVDDVAVCEVLEWTYVWQFDGTDDRLSLSVVPFQMADDHFVIAAGVKTGGADGDLFSARNNTSPTQIVGVVRINAAGTLLCVYRDDANTLIQSGIAGVVPLNTPFVAALRKTGHRKSIRRDSGSWVHEDTPMGATTVNVATIGGSMSNAFGQGWPGYMHMIAIGKGAITDGEVRELEKFAAKLQGRSL